MPRLYMICAASKRMVMKLLASIDGLFVAIEKGAPATVALVLKDEIERRQERIAEALQEVSTLEFQVAQLSAVHTLAVIAYDEEHRTSMPDATRWPHMWYRLPRVCVACC